MSNDLEARVREVLRAIGHTDVCAVFLERETEDSVMHGPCTCYRDDRIAAAVARALEVTLVHRLQLDDGLALCCGCKWLQGTDERMGDAIREFEDHVVDAALAALGREP